MPSARTVVEDSDDEGDLLTPEKVAEEEGETIAVKRLSNDMTNGTGSTERLRSDMLRAHDALFASEPTRKHDLDGMTDDKAGIQSPTVRAKRRKTTSGTGLSTPPAARLGRSKTVKTYGQSRGTSRSPMKEGFPVFKAVEEDGGVQSNARDKAKFEQPPAESPDSSHEQQLHQDAATAWNMRGSLLQDFAEHDPVAMFPSDAETGSTVPDNTNTQRRLIEEATRESGLSSLDQSPTVQSDGSLRSSAFRTTQATIKSPTAAKHLSSSQRSGRDIRSSQLLRGTGSPLKQPSNIDSQEKPRPPLFDESPVKQLQRSQSLQMSPRAGPPTPKSRVIRSTTPQDSPPKQTTASGETKTVGKRRSRSLVTHTSTAKIFSQISPAAKEVDPQAESHVAVVVALSDEQQSDIVANGAAPPPKSVQTEDHIEQQLDNLNPAPAPTTITKRKRKNEIEALEKLNRAQTYSEGLNSDDIAAIGLPIEQYKPRPSRSRSAQVAPAPEVAFSTNVEKGGGKVKNKRRKTIDINVPALHRDHSPDKQKVEAISNIGFTPARAKKALTSSHGNLEAAIEELIDVKSVTTRTRAEAAEAPAVKPAVKERTVEKEIAAALKTYSPERHKSVMPADPEQRQTATARKVVVTVQVPPAKSAKHTVDEAPLCDDEPLASPTLDIKANDISPVNQGRGRPRKIERTHDADELTVAPEAVSDAGQSPAARRKPGRPKKSVPKVLTEDEAADVEAGLDPEADAYKEPHANISELEPTKKRGRGRQKSAKSTEAVTGVYHDQPEVSESNANQLTRSSKEVLQELDANTKIAADVDTAPIIEPKKSTQTATPASSPAGHPAPTTPTKQRASDASSAQHSPLSKGKVAHRVGLNRKARIPSLLKIIRK